MSNITIRILPKCSGFNSLCGIFGLNAKWNSWEAVAEECQCVQASLVCIWRLSQEKKKEKKKPWSTMSDAAEASGMTRIEKCVLILGTGFSQTVGAGGKCFNKHRKSSAFSAVKQEE